MIKRYEIISFEKQEEKINELISKFGGLPVGLSDEKWPISAGWQDRRMMFIGQLLIEKGMFENEKIIMVYLFVTHPESYEDNFFDPDIAEWDGGENAVIIQTIEESHNSIGCVEGPILFDKHNRHYEYIPLFKEGYDPKYISNSDFRKLDSELQEKYFVEVDKNKVGGTPNFCRQEPFFDGEWLLLLQLKCEFLPFVIRTGTMGMLYVFISKDFKQARMIIQN